MHAFSFKRILGVAGLIALLTSIVVGAVVLKLRDSAFREADREISGLAGMLAEQVQQSAQSINLALNEVAATVSADSRDEFRSIVTGPGALQSLAAIAGKRDAIDLISIEDADGVTIGTSRGGAPAAGGPIYLLFDFFKHNRTRETSVGPICISEATGAQVVDFMRRIEASDGAFLGVARISVTPQSLVNTYSAISSMPGRSYALFTRDGSILARYPASNGIVGQRLPRSSDWYEAVAGGGGVYEGRSAFDDQDRIIVARPLAFSDLVVTVSVLRGAALANWRQQSVAIVICAGLALLIAGFLLQALSVQFRKLAEKETALRMQSDALAVSNERFATALGNMSQGLVVFDRQARVVMSNERYATMYGLEPHEVRPGVLAEDILRLRAARGIYAGPTPDGYVREALARRFTDQRIDYLSDGRAILVNHAACPDGGMVATHEDVTAREQANSRIAHMAMHDDLTNLANRALFLDALQTLRRGIGAAYPGIVVMLIDLDAFKPVNDTYGHVVGDAVLRECAQRILVAAPFAHVVARLGGDEFAIAFAVGDPVGPDPASAADGLIRAISRPYSVHDQSPEIGACVGIAVHTDPDLSTDDMLRRADLALYAAKAEGANCCRLFDPQMEFEALTRRELANDLARAIGGEELYLVYQPIVDVDTMAIVQMEALLRWRHPERGLIAPQEFIKLAEETRLIDELGAWVVRRACADAAQWPEHVGVAVNVSPLQLANEDFVDVVRGALQDAKLDAKRLELEITETALLQDRGDSLAALHRLHDRGVSIALDDFGTGFSSLSYLKRFPFDKLKIDRSFVADVSRDAGSAAIIATTVQLARAFDIEVTAEGVEFPEQQAALRGAGVRLMQGYLFAWPDRLERGLPQIGHMLHAAARRVA